MDGIVTWRKYSCLYQLCCHLAKPETFRLAFESGVEVGRGRLEGGREGGKRAYSICMHVFSLQGKVVPSCYLRLSEVWAHLGWFWLCCSQVVSSHTPTCSSAPSERDGLHRTVLSTPEGLPFPVTFSYPSEVWLGESEPSTPLGSHRGPENKGVRGMPREMSKELCLWPTLLFLSELLAGLYLWLFTKKACRV